MKKKVLILGSTGSIGTSTVDIMKTFPDHFEVTGLSAHSNDELLVKQAKELGCNNLILTGKEESTYKEIKTFTYERLTDFIRENKADIVVNGIAGSRGLEPSAAAIESGKDLALANKETLVMAGPLIRDLADKKGVKLLPVDSEHSALFYLLENRNPAHVEELILTASGGAFRDLKKEELCNVSLEDALKHPTWSMGQKITIDSASMANKGLEVIEACMLFHIPVHRIKVLIHPQSYVHSLIRTKDQAMYAQISSPDMRLPIQNALFFPDQEPVQSSFLDLAGKSLTFSEPDEEKYPMLKLAFKAAERGGSYPIAYNAANEVAVAAFLQREIQFMDIPLLTEKVLSVDWSHSCGSLSEVIKTDGEARTISHELIKEL